MSLLPLDPFAQREPLPVPPSNPRSIISTISSYYEFLARLPHIDSLWLHRPPEAGWTGINEEILRARNRTPQAIELLKHLPYLYRPAAEPPNEAAVPLTPDALCIAYHEGQSWDEAAHERCPTPGNVVWLARMKRWDGTALLLDVEAGTVTEFSHQSRGPPLIGMEERKALVPENRWMAHPTLSVSAYFREARRHYERLVWIPKPGENFSPGTWEILARDGDKIMDEFIDEDDADFDGDDDISMGEAEDDEDDSDDQMTEAYEALDLESDEVSALIEEARSDGTVSNDQNKERVLTRTIRVHSQDQDTSERSKLVERTWSELMAIYRRNHWPRDEFDQETCARELFEWRDQAEKRRRAEVLAMMGTQMKK